MINKQLDRLEQKDISQKQRKEIAAELRKKLSETVKDNHEMKTEIEK
jgi:hypothetical protein